MKIPHAAFVGCTLFAILCGEACAAQYTATLLHSVGQSYSEADGASIGGQVGYARPGAQSYHAILWHGTAASAIDLHPSGWYYSLALAVSGSTQVGTGEFDSSQPQHALLWSSTPESYVDLHPASYQTTLALGVSGNNQVGYGIGFAPQNEEHALVWTGTANSVLDLHPANFQASRAVAADGTSQVGMGRSLTIPHFYDHALLWHGTSESVVDLNPSDDFASQANGVSGNQQVGIAYDPTCCFAHAYLWEGTAASGIDLNPVGYLESYATAISAAGQVGNGRTGTFPHALVWRGTAASAIDLHPFLSGLGHNFRESYATGIDANGDIVGYAKTNSSDSFAVRWVLSVPEPSTAMLLSIALIAPMYRVRRHDEHDAGIGFADPRSCPSCHCS